MVGQAGTERIASFSLKPKGLDLTQSTNKYIALGASNFIMWGPKGCRKTIAEAASALFPSTIATNPGFIYISCKFK